jgi:hypothetical protein
MTLEERLLQKLAEWRPSRGDRQTLSTTDETTGWTVCVTADRHDELGAALWELTIRRGANARAVDVTVDTWARKLAGRLGGLHETLALIEVDPLLNQALLRSTSPTQRKEDLYYYELKLTGAREAHVRRYRGSHRVGRREQVRFTLTHEAIARLAADLSAY